MIKKHSKLIYLGCEKQAFGEKIYSFLESGKRKIQIKAINTEKYKCYKISVNDFSFATKCKTIKVGSLLYQKNTDDFSGIMYNDGAKKPCLLRDGLLENLISEKIEKIISQADRVKM